MCLASLPALPLLASHSAIVGGKIRWNRSGNEFLLHARLGDARLERLVHVVLLLVSGRALLSRVGALPTRRPYDLLSTRPDHLLAQRTINHFLTNQVLGVLAFAYCIEFRLTHDDLHTYADALEAFIESIFEGENDNANNTGAFEWLVRALVACAIPPSGKGSRG